MEKKVLYCSFGNAKTGTWENWEDIFKGYARGKPIEYSKEKKEKPCIIMGEIGQTTIDKDRDKSKDLFNDFAYIDIDVKPDYPELNHGILIDKAFSIGCLAVQKSNSGKGLHLVFEIPGRGIIYNALFKHNAEQATTAYHQVYIYFINLVTPLLLEGQEDKVKSFYSKAKEDLVKTHGYKYILADPQVKSVNRKMYLTPHKWVINPDYKPFKWPTTDTHYRIMSLVGSLMGGKKGRELEDYTIRAIVKTCIPDADDHTINDMIQHNREKQNNYSPKQKENKEIKWVNMRAKDYIFDTEDEAAEAVYNRFLSLYRRDSKSKETIYTLDGKHLDATLSDELLKHTVAYHRPAGGISKLKTIDSILLTGRFDHITDIFVDYSLSPGLTEDKKQLNIRPLCNIEKESETLTAEQEAELKHFMIEFNRYFRTRTNEKVTLKTGEQVEEILLLAAWFSAVFDLKRAKKFRPSLLFLQGEQGSGKSTCGECILQAVLGNKESGAITEISRWLDDRFTPEGYERSRAVSIKEARPQGQQLPKLKTEVREGTYEVEYKGQTKRGITTQHAVLLTTNDEYVTRELLQDRSLLCIGMDNVERAPDIVFDFLQKGECTFPIKLAHELKDYFDVLAHEKDNSIGPNCLIEAVRISEKALPTHKIMELQQNVLFDDPLFVEIHQKLLNAGLAGLSAQGICLLLDKHKTSKMALVKKSCFKDALAKGYIIAIPGKTKRKPNGGIEKDPTIYRLSDEMLAENETA